ncbi:MAG: UDP-N-acetylmuramate--L-alanine ligase [Chloroflexaceae bacterium]|nr:UDP-N-acetylmuramate--L-alanine ligase [Chloroflexaceae bacterium]
MQYHIVGVAGAGMRAIANLLLDQGHQVSGSDLLSNQYTVALAARGAQIYQGHAAAYVQGADALLVTAAVKPDHIELVAAAAAGIPRLRREDLWRQWSRQRTIIGVAGTHGKTTTTAMIASVLQYAGLHPGFLIGSDAPGLGTNARWGNPHAPLVIEADEYERAFLALRSNIAVVTNVEWDHPDIFPTEASYYETFSAYAMECEGVIVACGDGGIDHWSTTARINAMPFVTYGLTVGNDYQAILEPQAPASNGTEVQTRFRVVGPKNEAVFVQDSKGQLPASVPFELAVPGLHNVQNALAAIAVADLLGVPRHTSAEALRSFRGTARRFERLGTAGGITVIDDYAHHPTETRATLAAARTAFPQARLVVYMQPHTYSRTRTLLDAWGGAFADADVVLIGAIYAARERDPDGSLSGLVHTLVARIAAHHPAASYGGTIDEAIEVLMVLLQPGDVLLTLGAGDSNLVGADVLRRLTIMEQI